MEDELLEAKPDEKSALGKFHKLMEECSDESAETDFHFDTAIHQHVQFALKQIHKSRWVQPWERGIMAKQDLFPKPFQTGSVFNCKQASRDFEGGRFRTCCKCNAGEEVQDGGTYWNDLGKEAD